MEIDEREMHLRRSVCPGEGLQVSSILHGVGSGGDGEFAFGKFGVVGPGEDRAKRFGGMAS